MRGKSQELAQAFDNLVALPMRTVSELLAKAREFRQMAQTARTSETQTALLTLAGRYEAVARQIANDAPLDDAGCG